MSKKSRNKKLNHNKSKKTKNKNVSQTDTAEIKSTVPPPHHTNSSNKQNDSSVQINPTTSPLLSKSPSADLANETTNSVPATNSKIIPRDPYCVRFNLIFDLIHFLINLDSLRPALHDILTYFDTSIPQVHMFSLTSTNTSNTIPLLYIQADYLHPINQQEDEKTSPLSSSTKLTRTQHHRPSYLIERDRHVFGGCMDDEAEDEFFISSGAVYQSWPYVYEPGFRIEPLTVIKRRMSRSLSCIETTLNGQDAWCDGNSEAADEADLPAYSLDNYEINLFHVNSGDEKTKLKKKRRRIKRIEITENDFNEIYSQNLIDADNLVIQEEGNFDNNSLTQSLQSNSFSSECLSSSNCNPENLTGNNNIYYYYYSESEEESEEDEDDDSDSFIAYKRRHAIGLPMSGNSNNEMHANNLTQNTVMLNNAGVVGSTVKQLHQQPCRLSNSFSKQNNNYGSLCFGGADLKRKVCFLSQNKVSESYFNDYALLTGQHERLHNMYTSTLIV
jgi:hypothetical protein